jgi:hypothetical protein
MKPQNAIYISPVECYHFGPLDHDNLFGRLYVTADGEVHTTCEGSGCGPDDKLHDLDGWPIDEINKWYANYDLDVLGDDRDNLRKLGRDDIADWLDGWIRTCKAARGGVIVELEHMGDEATEEDRAKLVEALRKDGYTWARAARDGEAGDLSGITDDEWDRVMAETFNK